MLSPAVVIGVRLSLTDAVTWVGYVDLNHGPLPYQVCSGGTVSSRNAGHRACARPLGDRQYPSAQVRSGTDVAQGDAQKTIYFGVI
jgi:hypothetical protein